jgi:hypothetical protein
MKARTFHRTVRLFVAIMLLAAIATFLARSLVASGHEGTTRAAPTSNDGEADFANAYCKTNLNTAIPSGSEAEARKYYQDLSSRIGFQVEDPPSGQAGPTTTLVDVAAYLGYVAKPPTPPLTAKEDLQDASPAALMDPAALGKRLGGVPLSTGDVLVARFFAPKISDVSQPSVTQAGWRKLVRLRAQPSSAAAAHGIEYGIILFNFFAPIDQPDPFTGSDSVNTQTILVGSDSRKSLYWIDFGKTSEGAKLSHELDAFFDAGHIPAALTAQNGGKAPYFVPCSCISCHGGLRLDFTITPPAPDNHFSAPLLDYLDTDYWQDRTAKGDDFEGLKAPVLFDPGTFGVILLVNQEIQRQNVAAQPDSVLRRAAEHWLTWHLQQGTQPEALFDRALQVSANSHRWNPSDPTDAELLPKLNRLCFRCHGSVKFDVLDKEMVLALTSKLNAALYPKDQISDPRSAMPPDRNLSPDDLKKLRDLILRLKQSNKESN